MLMPERRESKRRWDRDNMLLSPNHHAGAGARPLDQRKVELMREMRANDKKVHEIALECGVYYSTVCKYTKDLR